MTITSQNEENPRYRNLINCIASSDTIWLLKAYDGLYAMFEDADGKSYVPIWGDRESAELLISEGWGEYQAESLGLREFDHWLNELAEDEIFIAASPDQNLSIIPVAPLVIRTHIKLAKFQNT